MDIRIVEKRKVQNGVEIDKYFIIELQDCYNADGQPWYIPLENEINRQDGAWRFPSFEEAKRLKEVLSKLAVHFNIEFNKPLHTPSYDSSFNNIKVNEDGSLIEIRQIEECPNSFYFYYFTTWDREGNTTGLRFDNVDDLITHLYETITITTSTIVG